MRNSAEWREECKQKVYVSCTQGGQVPEAQQGQWCAKVWADDAFCCFLKCKEVKKTTPSANKYLKTDPFFKC